MAARLSLDTISVASPCPASWEGMRGDGRVRSCCQCNQKVYNLSQMTREQAEDLLRQSEGKLCVRFFRRHDGTVMTADCPVGLQAVRRRLADCLGVVASALLFVGGIGIVLTASGPRGLNRVMGRMLDPISGYWKMGEPSDLRIPRTSGPPPCQSQPDSTPPLLEP
jgi:hypothetical protein